MTVIESLQQTNVGEEQSNESSKETGVAADGTELFSSNSQILEEAVNNSPKSDMAAEPLQTDKFNKASISNGKSSCQGRQLLEQPDVGKGETECGSAKPD